MRKLLSVVIVVALGSIGCGGSICTRMKTVVAEKNKACSSGTDAITDADVKACESKLSGCTGDDQAKINKYIDCYAALPACTPETEETFEKSAVSCAMQAVGVSQTCLAALKGSDEASSN